MRVVNRFVAALLVPVFFFATSAWAGQEHIVDSSAMRQALADKVSQDNANRALLVQVIHRNDVQTLAARMGLNLERAESAVATLGSAELNDLAQQAQTADPSLAGGSEVAIITITTLLLVVILLVVLLK
jgi:hypothetical protein